MHMMAWLNARKGKPQSSCVPLLIPRNVVVPLLSLVWSIGIKSRNIDDGEIMQTIAFLQNPVSGMQQTS